MRVLFAGGGTGGHIYPALAMAKAIQEIDPATVVEFVGTPAGLETQLVPRAGYKLHMISVGKFHHSVGIFERIKTLFKMPLSFLAARRVLREFQPDVVVGVGGYASGPAVLMAALSGRRTLIWEPNAHPGLANRWLSRFAQQSLVVFSQASRYMRADRMHQIAMPVRKEIEAIYESIDRSVVRGEFHFDFQILVFGGSQGARALNNAVLAAVQKGGAWLQDVKIVHQTGAADYARLRDEYARIPGAAEHVQVHEYLHDMPERYRWADLVISRAGTGTLSELAACGKAAILVPLPTAADDHQTKNAFALVEKSAAVLLPQKQLTAESLIEEIEKLKNDRRRLHQLEDGILRLHQPRAVYKIAAMILNQPEPTRHHPREVARFEN